ncbi:hypothetical protein [Candidatus Reidiella endopervernicosa]|uniref:Uncharacterized protein n=1 Tax=Candidatus Reidiella endopervernicosa TaxID=2738883 RepID=A0A6N0HYM7_9GAMM|nr:hypothetical protein [Candidatus Reidiella endopervernicosa]QKQ27484.1 hypothetical protein HUE57_15230 [Candidatus Reidiella endopervernicosa]
MLIHTRCRPLIDHYKKSAEKSDRETTSKGGLSQRVHQNFLPNNLLNRLSRRGLIELSLVELPYDKVVDSEHAKQIPSADIWIFALQNYQSRPLISESFLSTSQQRAEQLKIQTINLTSHIRETIDSTTTPTEFPCIAKLAGNGAVKNFLHRSYAILRDRDTYEQWRDETGEEHLTNYAIEKFHTHRLNEEIAPFNCIERWIHICADLTVGLRISDKEIIGQSNSLTSYRRDPRLFAGEFHHLLTHKERSQPTPARTSLPLTFSYMGDSDYWELRYRKLREHTQKSGLEIGSLDVIEDKHGELHIIDYNEHTLESAERDLLSLWTNTLYRRLNRGN